MALERKVCVSFQSLTAPLRKKVVTLPPKSEKSDLLLLKQILFTEMLFDESIKVLGGSKYTKMDDIVIYQFDATFEEEVELNSRVILEHGDRNLVVKLSPRLIKVKHQRSTVDEYGLLKHDGHSKYLCVNGI